MTRAEAVHRAGERLSARPRYGARSVGNPRRVPKGRLSRGKPNWKPDPERGSHQNILHNCMALEKNIDPVVFLEEREETLKATDDVSILRETEVVALKSAVKSQQSFHLSACCSCNHGSRRQGQMSLARAPQGRP